MGLLDAIRARRFLDAVVAYLGSCSHCKARRSCSSATLTEKNLDRLITLAAEINPPRPSSHLPIAVLSAEKRRARPKTEPSHLRVVWSRPASYSYPVEED